MSFPPPPPPNQPHQPHQPPGGAPGGFGPPAGGYGAPQGGAAPGGYGSPGGYGAPGPGGPGGWQQPPGPPNGGGNGKLIAAIIAGGAVVLAAVITVIVVANSDDSGKHQAQPSSSQSALSSPSSSETGYPSPSESATGSDDDSATPSPSSSKIPYYLLQTGDCYDRTADGGGYNEEASCNGPHDAEVVTTHRLEAGLSTESEIKRKASSLCRDELERKAARQPAGTVEGTFVQFPSINGYKLGIKSVSCSLTANSTGTRKLTKPLS
ncbi:hypothetical protein [Streptomyces sp. NPDC020742]|uniref:hypothetical protein n=1 Tax=unclassified Streptomyces TaxID=2593676 RepID=UPI0033C06EC0